MQIDVLNIFAKPLTVGFPFQRVTVPHGTVVKVTMGRKMCF